MNTRFFRTLCMIVVATIASMPIAATALTLQEGLHIVTENGRDVRISRSDESAAESGVALARSAYLPTVNAYGQETWLKYQPEAVFGNNSVPVSQDKFTSYGIRATQLLYDFGKTSSAISAASESLDARRIETARTRNRAAIEFINAYYDLLETNELLKVAQEEADLYEAHRKDADARFKAGVSTRNDLLQAEVKLADSKQRLLTTDNACSLFASRINSILMHPLNDPVQPSEIAGKPNIPISLDEAWALAEKENQDLRDLDAKIRAKEENLKSLRAEYLPTLYVAGGYDYTENQYQVHPGNWSALAGVNINLFAGGATDARIGMAKSELASLRMTREKLLDAVRLGVKSAWLELQSAAQKIQVTLAAVTQAAENLRLQRLRYQEGVGTATEVLDAVTLQTVAETNSWKANFDQKRAEAALLYAVGKDLAAAYEDMKKP